MQEFHKILATLVFPLAIAAQMASLAAPHIFFPPLYDL